MAGALNFGNTIVAGNSTTGGSAPEILYSGGTIASAGGNLVGDSAGDSTNTRIAITYHPTDKRDVNPLLGALANNGGETPTHALLTGSPAIDNGVNDVAVDPSNFITALAFDQRGTGFARIRDGNGDGSAIVDIGAFERSNASDSRPTMFDFDGDGKADISVFRPSNGFWHIMKSSGGFSSIQWGQKTDELVPGDYDGDGKTDVAVYRGIADNYNWYIRRSSDTTLFARSWGIDQGYGGVTPVPGDYDGDGKTDLTVQILDDFVGAQPYFKILQSSTNTRTDRAWRIGISAPPADFDGDGKTDLTSIDNFGNSAFWTILQSTNGARRGVQFGLSTDKFVPADYDGDGKADIAIYRPSDGTWYRFNSSDDSFSAVRFGAAEDKPVPADYDGDGRTDIAVFRPSNGTWYLQQSKEGFAAGVFGFGDDIPIPNVYIR